MPTKLSGNEGLITFTDSTGERTTLCKIIDWELTKKHEKWEKDLKRWRQLKTKRLKKKYLKRLIEPYIHEVYPVYLVYNKWNILGLARLKKYKLF
jgi:hypothetical protein